MHKTNKLALGTVQFGLPYGVANKFGKVSQVEAAKILAEAKMSSVDTLDTAISYGESEKVLGSSNLSGFKVITKLPVFTGKISEMPRWFENHLTSSLNRMRLDQIDGLMLHNSSQLLENYGDNLYKLLEKAKHDGRVKRIGISIYDPNELTPLFDRYNLDLIQAPGSVFDRRIIFSGWLKKLNKAKVDIHLRSIFLQGLLLMPKEKRSSQFNQWAFLFQKWQEWLLETNQSALDSCVQYALSLKGIEKIVVGVDSLSQFKSIVQAFKRSYVEPPHDLFSDDEMLLNPFLWKI